MPTTKISHIYTPTAFIAWAERGLDAEIVESVFQMLQVSPGFPRLVDVALVVNMVVVA